MPDEKLCFVVSPIGAEDSPQRIHADWVLEEIIEPVMADFEGFQVSRADKMVAPGLIDAQVIGSLLSADLVIADLSFPNQNVFYEIGIRHMAQKPIIHMQLATDTIPFDVSLYRAIKFNRVRPGDLRDARKLLRSQVQAVLSDEYNVENPITNARGLIKLRETATSGERVILSQMEAIGKRLERLEGAVLVGDTEPSPNRGRVINLMGALRDSINKEAAKQRSELRMKLIAADERDRIVSDIKEIVPQATVKINGLKVCIIFSAAPHEYAEIQRQIYELSGLQPDN
jgi:hypothetical protein